MAFLDALRYGVIGLGAILAILAYRLLSREQTVTAPRQLILRSVYVFMTFAIALALIGFAVEFIKREPQGGGAVHSSPAATTRSGAPSGWSYYWASTQYGMQPCIARAKDALTSYGAVEVKETENVVSGYSGEYLLLVACFSGNQLVLTGGFGPSYSVANQLTGDVHRKLLQ